MGVTTTNNKPFNPRGNDQSPLAFNRAKLFSGKALDFDGVNDEIDLDGFTMSGNTASFAFYLKADEWNNGDFIFDSRPTRLSIGGDSANANTLNIRSGTSWLKLADISDTTNTNHFVITIDGTTAKLFLNGKSFGYEVTLSSEIDLSSNANTALMSYSAGASSYFNGQLSGFKIFNTALTAAQVADLYNNPEKVVPTGVDNTALKLWLPMQEGAGTTALNGAPDALGSEEVTNGDFATDSDWTKGTGWTISGGLASSNGAQSSNSDLGSTSMSGLNNKGELLIEVVVDSMTAGSLSVTLQGTNAMDITNITSAGTYRALCETSDGGASLILRADSTFVGSVSSVSLKELKNCGTISGATWTHGVEAPVAQTAVINWNKGNYVNDGGTIYEVLVPQGLTAGRDLLGNLFENVRKQGALNLDGNSWAEVHDNESLDMTTDITAEAWVYWKQTTGSVDSGILARWSSITGRQFLIWHQNDTSVRFYTGAAASIYTSMTEGWHHIIGTYDGANRKLYVDGVLRDTDAYTTAMESSVLPIEIGRYIHSSTFATDDIVAQPRIYNRALTAEEVQRNYNAGKNTYTN